MFVVFLTVKNFRMWESFEQQRVEQLYSEIDIDETEISKLFDPLEWFAIVESGSGNNVSKVSSWYRCPKQRKLPTIGRFQHLIYDKSNDKTDNGQTDRWRDFFKSIIKKLTFHPSWQNVIQIGFSFLAVHPIKLAKQKPNAHVYVSYHIKIMLLYQDLRCFFIGTLHAEIFNTSRGVRLC